MTYTYAKLRKIRDLLWEELKEETINPSVEHKILVEHRLQSIIMAGLDENGVALEKDKFKKTNG